MVAEVVGNLHSVALIDLALSFITVKSSWEPSFCSLDRLSTLYITTSQRLDMARFSKENLAISPTKEAVIGPM